jgi:hypothetical protein
MLLAAGCASLKDRSACPTSTTPVGLLATGCPWIHGKPDGAATSGPVSPQRVETAEPALGTITQPAAPAPELAQRQAAEEQQKALQMRLQQLESILLEKDRAMTQASQELQAASADLVRTQEELRSWKQETAALKEKLRNAEKENVATLQSVITLMEKMTQHDEAPAEDPRPAKQEKPKRD